LSILTGRITSHKPEEVQVVLNLRTTTSKSVLSLPSEPSNSESDEPVYIQIHASVKYSTHPDRPVTLSTWRTSLERDIDGDSSRSRVWINSALTEFRSTSNPARGGGPPALDHILHRRRGFDRDLRESWDFLTVPSQESGEEVVVQHALPLEELEFWQRREDGYKTPTKPEKGEKFRIAPSQGSLGTFWWRWGDLEGDLKGKKFKNDNWYDGEKDEASDEGEEWVESQGDNGFGLTLEVMDEAEVEFLVGF